MYAFGQPAVWPVSFAADEQYRAALQQFGCLDALAIKIAGDVDGGRAERENNRRRTSAEKPQQIRVRRRIVFPVEERKSRMTVFAGQSDCGSHITLEKSARFRSGANCPSNSGCPPFGKPKLITKLVDLSGAMGLSKPSRASCKAAPQPVHRL